MNSLHQEEFEVLVKTRSIKNLVMTTLDNKLEMGPGDVLASRTKLLRDLDNFSLELERSAKYENFA